MIRGIAENDDPRALVGERQTAIVVRRGSLALLDVDRAGHRFDGVLCRRPRVDPDCGPIAALNHPNICALYDVADEHGADAATSGTPLFLVMEYLEGETLADRLARGALPVAQALAIATQTASALDKAHRAGIVHRDLKPGNVFLVGSKTSAAPIVQLLDFGLAKAAPPIGALSVQQTTAADLTTPGTIIGTVQYMSPEQVEGRDVDARTDIFAFGVALYEMLTGAKAFTGKSQASLTVAILEHHPPPGYACSDSGCTAAIHAPRALAGRTGNRRRSLYDPPQSVAPRFPERRDDAVDARRRESPGGAEPGRAIHGVQLRPRDSTQSVPSGDRRQWNR
ncbi:MAG TPA: serine/threonine-protein kinase [Vicinamibacterales bacterium]|nr:serine/threonine-protein kinase [Vicinamibacterales bacterium]